MLEIISNSEIKWCYTYMKKVLVPLAIHQDNPIIGIHGARTTYIDKLIQYDLMPLFVSPLMSISMIMELYTMSSGAYFIGGEDIDPKHYGQKKHEKTIIGNSKRDELEMLLIERILKDKKPFFGICRGLQTLAVASGGTLIQHLPDFIKDENHNTNENYDDLLDGNYHPALIEKNSRIFELVGKDKIFVNSYHHQAVDKLSKEFIISVKSPSGVAEGIEHINKDYFCFAVQSHPEVEAHGAFEKLYSEFKNAVHAFKN